MLLFVHFWLTLVELSAYLLICRNRASIIRKTRVNRNWPRARIRVLFDVRAQTHRIQFHNDRIPLTWLWPCRLLTTEKDRKKVPFKLKMQTLVRVSYFRVFVCMAIFTVSFQPTNSIVCVFFSVSFSSVPHLLQSLLHTLSRTQTYLMGRCICDFVVFFFVFRFWWNFAYKIINTFMQITGKGTLLRNDERRTPNTRWLHKHIKYPAGRAQKRRARKRKIVHNSGNCNKSPFARRRNCCHSSSSRRRCYYCRCWCHRRRRSRRSA